MNETINTEIFIECLRNLLENKDVDPKCGEILSTMPEYEKVYDSLLDIRNAITDISSGKLDYKLGSKGYFPGVIKNLQSTLLHLIWQTKAISSGNFVQTVDFLGEFSEAFNTMTEQVEQHIKQIEHLETESRGAKEHFEAIFNTSPDATVISTLEGTIIDVNDAFCEIFTYEKEKIIGKNYFDIGLFRNYKEDIETAKEEGFRGDYKNLELVLLTNDNRDVTVLNSAKIINLKDEPHIISVSRDVTERKIIEEELRKSEEKYRLLTEFTSDVIWVLNLESRKFTYISPSIYNLRGITSEEAMAETIEDAVAPETLGAIKEKLGVNSAKFYKNPNGNNSYIHEIQQPHKDGSIIWVEASTKYRYNDKGQVEVVGVSRNIEERKKAEREVLYLSYNDQLTGLYNRRFYEEKLFLMDKEENLPISLIMADVNGLKLTNDAFGHREGDTLLKIVSRVLKEQCGEDGIVSRVGGDEFVILLPNTNSSQAEEKIANIKQALSKEKMDSTVISVSLGYSTKQNIEDDITNIYTEAEDNMYQHKLSESKNMKAQTIKLIINSLYERDLDEERHGKTVSILSGKIGFALGFDKESVSKLKMAGLLHDIGNVGISEDIFNKPGALTAEEWEDVKRHPEIGYQILRSTSEFSHISDWILSHHERLDGKGYPRRLKGEEISIYARIIALANAYEAMTSNRVYKNKLNKHQAIEEIKDNLGTQFDEEVAKVFVEKVLKENWV